MGEIARRLNSHIVVGMAERDDGDIFNTVIWVDTSGDTVARFRKLRLTTEREWSYFTPGEHRVYVQLGDYLIGLGICYDLGYFPELIRADALEGVDLVLAP